MISGTNYFSKIKLAVEEDLIDRKYTRTKKFQVWPTDFYSQKLSSLFMKIDMKFKSENNGIICIEIPYDAYDSLKEKGKKLENDEFELYKNYFSVLAIKKIPNENLIIVLAYREPLDIKKIPITTEDKEKLANLQKRRDIILEFRKDLHSKDSIKMPIFYADWLFTYLGIKNVNIGVEERKKTSAQNVNKKSIRNVYILSKNDILSYNEVIQKSLDNFKLFIRERELEESLRIEQDKYEEFKRCNK